MQADTPLVSVAVVTYNQLGFLRECLDSVDAQTYSNIEIVVADDGSTDGTQDFLRARAANTRQPIKLSLSQTNRGVTANCQAALDLSTGDFVAWIGGDDLMDPSEIERQVAFMQKEPDVTISYHDLRLLFQDTGEVTGTYNREGNAPRNGDVFTAARYGTFNAGSSNMVRMSTARGVRFDSRIGTASDWLYWVECLAAGGLIEFIPDALGVYRRHASSVTSALDSSDTTLLREHLSSCAILLQKHPSLKRAVKAREAQLLLSMGVRSSGRERRSLALASFKRRPSLHSIGLLLPERWADEVHRYRRRPRLRPQTGPSSDDAAGVAQGHDG